MTHFDRNQFMNLIEGDQGLANTLVGLFAEDCPQLVKGIEGALSRGKHKEVEQLAHRLKGNLRNFFAQNLANIAEEIEDAGRDNELPRAEAALRRLDPLLGELQQELHQFNRTLVAPDGI